MLDDIREKGGALWTVNLVFKCEEMPSKDFNEDSDIISMSSSLFQEECTEGKKENGNWL